MPIGTAIFSYASAALAFVVLCLLLLTSWRGRPHARAVAGASAAMVLWSGAMIWLALGGRPVLLASAAEWLRDGAWTAVLLALLGHLGSAPGERRRSRAVPVVAALYALLLTVSAGERWLPAALVFHVTVVGRVGLAVLGMLLVEQLYRNKAVEERWAIKFACLGIGGIFVYDFYMYSDMLLFREMNGELWAARGIVNALTMPLIGISLARSAAWSGQIAVSRRMLFHSAALIGSAVYLLAMSSAAYYLRFVGGAWGSLMQLAFLFGASLLLAGILFSGSFRAWLRVFISKHFYRYNYDYREEWLRFTRTLSQQGPGLGERSIQALAALVESPGGALWLRRETQEHGRFEPAAHWETVPGSATEPADSPFCRFIEQKQWVVDLTASGAQHADAALPALPEWLRAFPRAWLVVPLMQHGRLAGFVVLQQPRSAVALNWEVLDLLKVAGTQAASYLAQQEADNALMLARQFDSFNRLSTFVVHDLKNLVAQLSLLTANAEKHRDNPEFQRDMHETVNYSVQKMKLMLQKLSRSATPERAAPLAVDQLLQQAVALKAAFEPRPVLQIERPGLTVLADAERLARVLGHLIQNAIEATPRDGRVTVRLSGDGAGVQVEVSDTGQGMSADFVRERLFKPFDSTKSAGMGIGAFESREYIHELGGRLDVRSEPLHGTTFTVSLPACRADAIERAA
ncbi:XrtA/PEP-CTERM system histidine kinase PrsK [Pseudoduganella chitinolytica]|uniref:histidine kinase n=1 Tax=Pseudoduganella chitinolytica TaxID=34070 RepID=A0ABY8B7W5_9BURK|nr:XrtA/PEP-CTERM system histidine kinase PrsK [Pseudoduganella chitinolytica]WEF31811.1 PEP-CTERM system histidine kinase PrsK [Pseudoduganella chitinolytica]